ncbi:hypothetical protein CROQUDRAFT_670276 [Cronartium quercuum f. sp. fusiforme G11]|uniref:tRNA wybutosine-synthesizing protein 4 n=1 Tax=Cronartium quercuum f. sp. fusiforme G11 TaxID=708437 RepID=A0A9P6NQT8_9BASI|nr:hypothetical protein CROQUDRAFT_670276 [Cronartium quercuum f. sp. fusiforme G11]
MAASISLNLSSSVPQSDNSIAVGTSPANLVIGTNDSSIVSKRSAERLGYFSHVQHLRHFVSKPRRRAPLINLGYAIRTIFIDLIIQRFLDTHFGIENASTSNSDSSMVIVNLGAGYDPGFFKLACLPSKELKIGKILRYVDADYPDLIKKKHAMICRSPELSAMLPGFSLNPTSNFITTPDQRMSYALLGCDLCDTKSFINSLIDLLGGSQATILFISEVSTVYMPATKSNDLLSGLSQAFPRAVYACLEQVLYPSPTAFSETMLGHFRKLQTPLRGTIRYPTVRDQVIRLGNWWKIVEISTLLELWNRMDDQPKTSEEKIRLLNVEEFDEWEELHIFLSHYLVAITYSHPELMAPTWKNLTKINLPPLTMQTEQPVSEAEKMNTKEKSFLSHLTMKNLTIQRRGHSMSLLSDGSHLIFGGYGLSSSAASQLNLTHSRLSHPTLLVPTGKEGLQFKLENLPLTSTTPCARIYHITLSIKRHTGESVLIFGGRKSPRAPLDDLHILDVRTQKWSQIIRTCDSPWPEARYRHAAVSMSFNDNHQLCLIHGGIGKDGRILSDTWLFDPERLVWSQGTFLDDVIGPRHSHQICYKSSELIIFGGVADSVAKTKSTRIAPNVKVGLKVGVEGNLLNSVTLESLEFKHSKSFLNRYAHRITPWNCTASVFLMSGGLVDSGIIPPQEQCYLLDTNTGKVTSLDLSECEGARCLVDHTCSLVSTYKKSTVAIILGGGITCFSMGSQFDTNLLLLSDSAFEVKESDEFEENHAEPHYKTRSFTFDSDVEDTWNCEREIPRIEGSISTGWQEALSGSEPVVFSKLDLGDCLTIWTPDYLKEKCGELRCSVHISNQSSKLTWHNKNFKYKLMLFKELIENIFMNPKPLETLYFRSLSTNSIKVPSNFNQDFIEISKDFKIPEPLHQIVMSCFFSSVLRISGADMGLWAHYDTCDNILAQIKGKKLIRMWHPSEAPNLYIEGSSSHIPNFDKPNLNKFPLYRKSHPMITILEPGDVLFIPATWLHSVKSLESSISINIFFRTQSNHLYSTHDVWGNVDPLPIQKFEREITLDAIKLLDELPLFQRQLYLKKIGMNLIRLADQQQQ